MSERKEKGGNSPASVSDEQYSLSDDRRVKVLSPGMLVAKRFFRNRLAVFGLVMLGAMAIFSFVGGFVIPYGQSQQFYTTTYMKKEYVGVTRNEELRFMSPEGQSFGALPKADFYLARAKGDTEFTTNDQNYTIVEEKTDDLYSIYQDGVLVALAYKDIVNAADGMEEPGFQVKYEALKAYVREETSFEADGTDYTLDENGSIMLEGTEIGYISRFVVAPRENGIVVTRDFREKLEEALQEDIDDFVYTDADGVESEYSVTYDASAKVWSVRQSTPTYVYMQYASPSIAHPLGTDGNGMDMMVRLMYGGRVSLVIGFIVVFIETFIGIILGGIAGYFGKWADQLIMRIVDIFYCIPSMPIIIILGATMDNLQVNPMIRMIYLMLILGFLGWPGIARMVRGQILSLREQEFMTAAEACGISAWRRIFKHLIPNVIPQLIVLCTMGLGSVIITESTLSFLGLGVKFPFASWGNIISDVNNSFVMTNYWFIWIPAGICLLITVLGFNFVGDGLRDAFDPKMKR